MNINDNFKYLNIGLPDDILRHKMAGNFKEAIRLIDLKLENKSIPEALRACLTIQRELISRMHLDYPYSKEEALALVRESIPDFSEEEFNTLLDLGTIGWIYINGEMRFFNRFFASLCKTNGDIAKRAGIITQGVESIKKNDKNTILDEAILDMKENGFTTRRFRIKASLKLKDENFKKGMFIRAHLPIPCECDEQSDIKIEEVYPANGNIAPINAPQRTVCWEENMEENHEFYVIYSYVYKSVYKDSEKIIPDKEQPSFFTEEKPPHIVFTPYIKELVRILSEGAENNLDKARRFYDFITLNMKYNFMPAYFSLENIAENCARNFSGDCGVFALLFLTLCRCAGIPARWESGLDSEPDFCGGHDWIKFYIAPYGWLFADTSYGVAANRIENEERRKFYFGNIEPYRTVLNSDFQEEFTIPKKHWRADPYDNQVGEMETEEKGLAYNEFDRSKVTLECIKI